MSQETKDPIAELEKRQADETQRKEKLASQANAERNAINGNYPSAQTLSELAGLGDKEYLDQTVMPLLYRRFLPGKNLSCWLTKFCMFIV